MSEPLDFDRAEFGDRPAGVVCAGCHRPVEGSYFEINGRVTCAACHAAVERALHDREGAAARFFRALGLGLGAAAAGTVVWYAILVWTGYEIGLIAIGVGFLVGLAVKRGSNGRGGWGYQSLAVALTYASITASYMPVIVSVAHQKGEEVGALGYLIAFAIGLGAPFIHGIKNLLGLVIIAFALWEAWKLNKRPALTITGPYRLASTETPPNA